MADRRSIQQEDALNELIKTISTKKVRAGYKISPSSAEQKPSIVRDIVSQLLIALVILNTSYISALAKKSLALNATYDYTTKRSGRCHRVA